jgi:hypothetical protein
MAIVKPQIFERCARWAPGLVDNPAIAIVRSRLRAISRAGVTIVCIWLFNEAMTALIDKKQCQDERSLKSWRPKARERLGIKLAAAAVARNSRSPCTACQRREIVQCIDWRDYIGDAKPSSLSPPYHFGCSASLLRIGQGHSAFADCSSSRLRLGRSTCEFIVEHLSTAETTLRPALTALMARPVGRSAIQSVQPLPISQTGKGTAPNQPNGWIRQLP